MAQRPQAPSTGAVRLRGDYAAAASDYTVPQEWSAYRPDEQRRWRQLFRRQAARLATHAAPAFGAGLRQLGVGPARIPRLDAVSERLAARSGWRLVGVPGLIPEAAFFAHLAARRFPVTVWLRGADELDYLAEPDLFHDFFGHVPLLADHDFAAFVAAYGARGSALAAAAPAALVPLARLYWYGVEFALLRARTTPLCAAGAGILSSPAETEHALHDAAPLRLEFDAARVLRTDYVIDGFQRVYFVLEDLGQLYRAVADPGFEAECIAAAAAPALAPGERVAGDRPLPPVPRSHACRSQVPASREFASRVLS